MSKLEHQFRIVVEVVVANSCPSRRKIKYGVVHFTLSDPAAGGAVLVYRSSYS